MVQATKYSTYLHTDQQTDLQTTNVHGVTTNTFYIKRFAQMYTMGDKNIHYVDYFGL